MWWTAFLSFWRNTTKGKHLTITYPSGGVAATYTYDQDYQLTGINTGAGAIQNLTNGFDLAGNITAITDNQISGRTQTLTYDNLNRVATAGGAYGSQSYTYDGVGNRLTRVVGSTTDSYAYSPTANRIATITTGSNVRAFTISPVGRYRRMRETRRTLIPSPPTITAAPPALR